MKGTQAGLVRGLCPRLVNGGAMCLQYADDTILFIQESVEYAKNLKWILTCFEKLFGFKINFHKSELFCFGNAAESAPEYAKIFGC